MAGKTAYGYIQCIIRLNLRNISNRIIKLLIRGTFYLTVRRDRSVFLMCKCASSNMWGDINVAGTRLLRTAYSKENLARFKVRHNGLQLRQAFFERDGGFFFRACCLRQRA